MTQILAREGIGLALQQRLSKDNCVVDDRLKHGAGVVVQGTCLACLVHNDVVNIEIRLLQCCIRADQLFLWRHRLATIRQGRKFSELLAGVFDIAIAAR